MGSYKSSYPDIDVDPLYKAFFENFYKVSDTPDAHEEYAKQFTTDGTLIIASKKAEGTAAIVAMREAMWEKVSSRAHFPLKIFPFGANSDELMLYGQVEYALKEGGSASVPWAARAHMTKEEGKVRMDYYQVYLDTAAQKASK